MTPLPDLSWFRHRRAFRKALYDAWFLSPAGQQKLIRVIQALIAEELDQQND